MIEFNGYLTGASEKFFFKKTATYAQNIWLFGFIGIFPLVIILMKFFQTFSILYIYGAAIVYILIAVRIHTPKGRKALTPNRIYITDNKMVCITDKLTEKRSVELVKKVYDYGEFYFISFYFGKISCNFICQKSLLTQGTIEDFEKLFDGKIVRKNENR